MLIKYRKFKKQHYTR